jgi:hypothetical protein
MRKKKFPKYVQQKFEKPQFKIGDYVKYEFLGEHGWGYITKIQKFNETVSYMVKGNGYTYPCGLLFKTHSSYYAGSIDFEASKNKANHAAARDAEIKKSNDNRSGRGISRTSSNTIPSTGSRYKSTNDIRSSNAQDIDSNKSFKKTNENELDLAIEKQKNFLRKFTK